MSSGGKPKAPGLGYGWPLAGDSARLRPLRDITMMRMIDAITDKPNWVDKIRVAEIREKWRQEFFASAELTEPAGISDGMVDRVLDELMFYADGMGALDFPIDPSYIGVYKSDLAVSEHEKNALRDAVRPLEEVPDHLKDWHPNSDGKVLDLVHPSMWPLIVGQTREMPSGTAEFCSMLRYAGAGTVIEDDHPRILMDDEIRDLLSWNERQRHISLPEVFSEHYHWLPAEVEISRSAGSLRTRFTSYVNNLHPELQQPAYAAIESILARCVPLWDRVLADSLRDAAEPTETIPPTTSASQADTTLVSSLRCESFNANCLYGSDYAPVGYADNEEAYSQWYATRTPVQMEAAKFVPPEVLEPSNILSSRQKFQVIVKLANIELGPGKEHYDGGSWHVEGQLNEKIRASAIYYYDECNVSPSRLAFRQTSEELENYEQDDETGLGAIFGMTRDAARLQTLGSVLTREDRIVAFPNSLQHRVSPFELIDKTRRGWRKILAFFLIDPELPIMSTATIPPQRMDWWAAQVKLVQPFAGLPTEIFDLIISHVDFPISLKSAKEERLKLMAERSAKLKTVNHFFEEENLFNLCEH